MPILRDWVDLGRNTIESLKSSDVTNLYSVEWPETKRMLIADQREAIEQEPKRIRRFVFGRSGCAIAMCGTAEREMQGAALIAICRSGHRV